MGSSLQVYVGPFYLVPKQEVQVMRSVRACSNTATCGQPAKGSFDKFCPACGSAIVNREVPDVEHRYPTPDDLDGDWTDLMNVARLENKREVWYPNHRGFGESMGASQAGGLHVYDPKTAEEALAKFRKYHRGIFDAFHAKFGVELIEAYGTVAYYW
jgi:hypothetical protein